MLLSAAEAMYKPFSNQSPTSWKLRRRHCSTGTPVVRRLQRLKPAAACKHFHSAKVYLLNAASTAVFDMYVSSSGGCSVSNVSRVAGTKDSIATPATRARVP